MKDVYCLDTQKSTAEVTRNSAQTAQNICRREEYTIVERTFASTAIKPHKMRDKKICKEYKIKATKQNKMRLDKCDAYTAKETLGYSG